MFERFTERARRTLFFARYEASEFGSPSIDTEHLLLGLIRDGQGLIAQVFAHGYVSLEEMRQRIESRIEHREKISTSVEIPFSMDVRRVFDFAVEEADRVAQRDVGSAHLLIAMLRVEESLPARLMTEAGMTLDALRTFVATIEATEHSAPMGTIDVATLADTLTQIQSECAELRSRVERLERELPGTADDPS